MSDIILTKEYKDWLISIKQRIRSAQLKAAAAVNTTLLEFYWQLGADIIQRQKDAAWGTGFLKQLSQDLRAEFPSIKGFSHRNLKYIRQWHLFYSQDATHAHQGPIEVKGKQAVSLFVEQITPEVVFVA